MEVLGPVSERAPSRPVREDYSASGDAWDCRGAKWACKTRFTGNQAGPRQLQGAPARAGSPGRDRDRLASSHHVHQGENDRRPVHAESRRSRPIRIGTTWSPFHEYFHGDNGTGVGARHQTGWTGTVVLGWTGTGALLFLLGGELHAESGATAGLAG